MKPARIFLIVVLILLVLSLGLSGYLYFQLKQTIAQRDGLNQEKVGFGQVYEELSKQLKEKEDETDAQKFAEKYNTFTLLSKCNLGLSYPDETKTYFGEAGTATKGPYSRAWRLNYKAIGNDEKFSNSYVIFKGGSKYSLVLRNDDDASGYIPGLIDIECIENTEGKTLEELTQKYLKTVGDNNIAMESVTGVKAKTLVVKKDETVQKWGTTVDKLTINTNSITDSYPSTEYLLVNGNEIVHISYVAGTGDKKAIQSLNSILDSIYLY